MEVLYKCGGRLVCERTRRPSPVTMTELLFADDAAVVGTARESMERAAHRLDVVTSKWYLTVSVTKLIVTGAYRVMMSRYAAYIHQRKSY